MPGNPDPRRAQQAAIDQLRALRDERETRIDRERVAMRAALAADVPVGVIADELGVHRETVRRAKP